MAEPQMQRSTDPSPSDQGDQPRNTAWFENEARMKDPAYFNKQDPMHEIVKAQVAGYFASQYSSAGPVNRRAMPFYIDTTPPNQK